MLQRCDLSVRGAGKEFLDPILLNLNIPQFSKSMKNFLGISFELVPARGRIGIRESIRHRSASSQRYAQIMDVGGAPGLANLLSALEDAFHPLL